MKREPVVSRAIREVGYEAPDMEVMFTSGSIYRYFDVPEFLYRGLMLAKSKGAYFAKRIQGRFRFEEVK
jgi:hypothetical protein